ncbi:MAG: hypothetical protein IPM35_23740 [Myxococcales bacterium]|nr:hypothetical protein [Myxococcales bacterium]
MSDVERLKRLLLSLADTGLRVGWLSEQLEVGPVARSARLLDELCDASERSDPEAREALLAVSLYFVSRAPAELIERLREEAQSRHLLGLSRLLRRGPPPVLVDRPATELPVPDYGAGRELTLGERRSLARRPNRRSFDKLLSDPHPLVIRLLLQNPKIVEDDVVRLVARRPARAEVIAEVAQSLRWLSRSRVRLAIVLNPGSPPEIAMPLLPVCKRTELKEVVRATESSMVLRATALELLERRPPIKGVDRADAVLQ